MSTRSKRWTMIATLLAVCGICLAIAIWYLVFPQPHHAINKAAFTKINQGMSRTDVETLLHGPPRIESTSSKPSFWDMEPGDSWGKGVTPREYRSIMSLDRLDTEERRKQVEVDVQIEKAKKADIAENGLYLLAWHHDLVTITVVFDGTSDKVEGATLWLPGKKSWREHPPFRWFR